MGNIAFLHELKTTMFWHIEYNAGKAYSEEIRGNFLNRTHGAEGMNETAKSFLVLKGEDRRRIKNENALMFANGYKPELMAPAFNKVVVAQDGWSGFWRNLEADDQVINCISVNGPITRNGGGCSMGSIEVRDAMIFAANQQQTVGHILYIDSCGGASSSSYDFEQGINAARMKQQPVIALVDGDCCSAALHLAAMCDEIYYMHPKNRIGSIGTMAAFFTMRDGDRNTVTQEVYHERYADVSMDKNKMFRDASDMKMDEIDELINENAREFAEHIKALKPKTPKELLTGRVITCEEAEKFWTKGQNDLNGCIKRTLELRNKMQRNK